jgi:hypothetical protein
MQLTEWIWLVGSGLQGFGLTNDFDCHVYLVDCGASAVLVDSGAGIEADRIGAEIAAAGFTPERISHPRWILPRRRESIRPITNGNPARLPRRPQGTGDSKRPGPYRPGRTSFSYVDAPRNIL